MNLEEQELLKECQITVVAIAEYYSNLFQTLRECHIIDYHPSKEHESYLQQRVQELTATIDAFFEKEGRINIE